MARSDNPEWNLTEKTNFRIPQHIKNPANAKAALLKADGYEIDDTFLPGPFDLTKYIRAQLVLLANETAEESVRRLGLKKSGAGR